MDSRLYDKLGEKPNALVCWDLIREEVGMQLLGDGFVTVPYLNDSNYFDLLFIFKKDVRTLEKLKLVPSSYAIIGYLDSLINQDESNWNQNDLKGIKKDDKEFNQKYQYQVSNMKNGLMKEIDLTIRGCRHYSVGVDIEKTFTLDTTLQALQGVHQVYIITDVVYAYNIDLKIRFGSLADQFRQESKTPIGFAYRKFAVRSDGSLSSQVSTRIKTNSKSSQWKRPSSHRNPRDALPPTPLNETPSPSLKPVKRNPKDDLPLIPASGSRPTRPPPPIPSDDE